MEKASLERRGAPTCDTSSPAARMRTGTQILLLVLLLTCAAAGTTSAQKAPYGMPIPDTSLDGLIGNEWADAASFSCYIRTPAGQSPRTTYEITVYIKHDCKYLYIAMVKSGPFRGSGPTAWVCFDVPKHAYVPRRGLEVGDDSAYLPLTGGGLVAIDRVYDSPWDGVPSGEDVKLSGTNDKWGAARDQNDTFVYEMKIDMGSGDTRGRDVSLVPGGTVSLMLGLMDTRMASSLATTMTRPVALTQLGSNRLDVELEEPEGYTSCAWMVSLRGQTCSAEPDEKSCQASWRSPQGVLFTQLWLLSCDCVLSTCRWSLWVSQPI